MLSDRTFRRIFGSDQFVVMTGDLLRILVVLVVLCLAGLYLMYDAVLTLSR